MPSHQKKKTSSAHITKKIKKETNDISLDSLQKTVMSMQADLLEEIFKTRMSLTHLIECLQHTLKTELGSENREETFVPCTSNDDDAQLPFPFEKEKSPTVRKQEQIKEVLSSVDPTENEKKAATKEDVISALQRVNSERGMLEAMNLLKSFGANRVSELTIEKYGDFLEAVKVNLEN